MSILDLYEADLEFWREWGAEHPKVTKDELEAKLARQFEDESPLFKRFVPAVPHTSR